MIRVALVDDHAIVREGYRALLSHQQDMQVVAEFADAARAYEGLRDAHVDVVVLDLGMPGASALEMLGRLRLRQPAIAVLVFTMHARASYARQAFAAGARGYLTKSSEATELLQALRTVAAGRRYVAADVARLIALDTCGGGDAALASLTVREFEVLRLLLAGRDVDTISGDLNLSPKTVRNLHYLVKRKLGARDDIDLVRLAVQRDLIDLLEPQGQPDA